MRESEGGESGCRGISDVQNGNLIIGKLLYFIYTEHTPLPVTVFFIRLASIKRGRLYL